MQHSTTSHFAITSEAFVTVRIRRTGEGNTFSLFVSPHPGGNPVLSSFPGDWSQVLSGVPQTWLGGNPLPGLGYPWPGLGYPSGQEWGTPWPVLGTPSPVQDCGTPLGQVALWTVCLARFPAGGVSSYHYVQHSQVCAFVKNRLKESILVFKDKRTRVLSS